MILLVHGGLHIDGRAPLLFSRLTFFWQGLSLKVTSGFLSGLRRLRPAAASGQKDDGLAQSARLGLDLQQRRAFPGEIGHRCAGGFAAESDHAPHRPGRRLTVGWFSRCWDFGGSRWIGGLRRARRLLQQRHEGITRGADRTVHGDRRSGQAPCPEGQGEARDRDNQQQTAPRRLSGGVHAAGSRNRSLSNRSSLLKILSTGNLVWRLARRLQTGEQTLPI